MLLPFDSLCDDVAGSSEPGSEDVALVDAWPSRVRSIACLLDSDPLVLGGSPNLTAVRNSPCRSSSQLQVTTPISNSLPVGLQP